MAAWVGGWRFDGRGLVLAGVALVTLMVGTAQADVPPRQAGGVLRCGWFDNPTPGNAWLTDRHGEWLIGVQGGHQAEGDWPVFSDAQWVASNGHYGHGCACLRLRADKQRQVLRILHAEARPLAACQRDRRLPKRSGG